MNETEKEITDSDRWQFIKQYFQSHSLKMDGQHSWRSRTFRYRGSTFEEAVDAGIKYETDRP